MAARRSAQGTAGDAWVVSRVGSQCVDVHRCARPCTAAAVKRPASLCVYHNLSSGTETSLIKASREVVYHKASCLATWLFDRKSPDCMWVNEFVCVVASRSRSAPSLSGGSTINLGWGVVPFGGYGYGYGCVPLCTFSTGSHVTRCSSSYREASIAACQNVSASVC